MIYRHVVLVVLLSLTCAVGGHAHGDKLAHLIPNLFGEGGLTVDSTAPLPGETDQFHTAHFNAAFQSQFSQFNIALGTQLSALPIPTAASGFTYTFDPETGGSDRSTMSFGPILAERAETIGKKKISYGTSYQYFSFDELEGVDLDRVSAVFTHDDPDDSGRSDVVTTLNSISVSVGQLTTFFTYGLTDRLDLSIAVPIVTTDLEVASQATIRRLGTAATPETHFFGDPDRITRGFSASGSATGVGDVIVRLKRAMAKKGSRSLALGVDVRLPTGDEEDFLGSGAEGFKPFAVLSFAHKTTSPHINLAYQWNGDSVLAGDVLQGTEGDLPDQFFLAVGADIVVSETVTLALDLLGRRVIDTPRLETYTFTGMDSANTPFSDIRFSDRESFNVINGAIGAKFNPSRTLLVNVNLLISLDDNGLRDDLTALVGFEYSPR